MSENRKNMDNGDSKYGGKSIWVREVQKRLGFGD